MSMPSNSAPVPTISATLRRSRLGMLAGGIVWVLLASSLCGCGKSHAWVMNQSGRAYFRQGNYVAARSEFERAMMDNPYRASYAFNVAKTMEKQGDSEGAEQMYQHALTLDPAHRPSYRGLSTLLNTQGRNDDARQLLTAWSRTQPYSAAANVELAEIEKSAGNYAGAEQQLNLAMDKRPGYLKARRDMKELQRDMGRPDLARNLIYYRRLNSNPYYQSQQGMMGIAPSQHLSAYMPQFDSRIKGGVIQGTYGNYGYGMNHGMMPMGNPMEMSAPMEMGPMSAPPGTTITPIPSQGEQYPPMGPALPAPGAQFPTQPMSMQPMPVHGAPVYGSMMPAHEMPFPGQPMNAVPMHGQPVMNGQPVYGQSMHGQPMVNGMLPPASMPAGTPVPSQQVYQPLTPGSPVHSVPVQVTPMSPVPPQGASGQMVPSPYSAVPPGGVPAGIPHEIPLQTTPVPGQHPVELGAPVPVTQFPQAGPTPTIISGTPSIPAF